MSSGFNSNPSASSTLDLVVVDDNMLTLEIVSWIFKNSDSNCRTFIDADSAMDCLKECMPKMLIVDYYMPTINGVDFLSELYNTTGLENCEAFLCSAVVPEQEQLDQLESLGAGLLEKEQICDREILLALVALHTANVRHANG